MCQYTRKHICREPHYEIIRNGKSRIYCEEAIRQSLAHKGIIYIVHKIDGKEGKQKHP